MAKINHVDFERFEPHHRKGVACHAAIVESLLNRLTIDDADKVLFVDVLPNRPGHHLLILFDCLIVLWW